MTWWRRLRRLALTYTTRTFFLCLLLHHHRPASLLFIQMPCTGSAGISARWPFSGQSVTVRSGPITSLLARSPDQKGRQWLEMPSSRVCVILGMVMGWMGLRGKRIFSGFLCSNCWSPKCGWNYFFFSSLNGMKMSSTTSCCSSIDKFREVLNEVLKKSSSPPLFLGRCTNVPTQSVCWGAGGDCCSVVIADFPVSFFLFIFYVFVIIFFFVFLPVCVGHCLPLPRQ